MPARKYNHDCSWRHKGSCQQGRYYTNQSFASSEKLKCIDKKVNARAKNSSARKLNFIFECTFNKLNSKTLLVVWLLLQEIVPFAAKNEAFMCYLLLWATQHCNVSLRYEKRTESVRIIVVLEFNLTCSIGADVY